MNQLVRFCPNVTVAVPQEAQHLVERCQRFAEDVHGAGAAVGVAALGATDPVSAVVTVGNHVAADLSWVTVNALGWVARVGTGSAVARPLPHNGASRTSVIPRRLGKRRLREA